MTQVNDDVTNFVKHYRRCHEITKSLRDSLNLHNLVIELDTRADFDRNKFADDDDEHVDGSSLSDAIAAD